MGDGPATITNKTFTAKIDGNFDLCCPKLLQLPHYRPPSCFRGGVLHISTETYLLLWPNKVVILGSESEPRLEAFTSASDICLKNLKCSRGYYTAETESPIDFFSRKLRSNASYKPPSKFSGAILKLPGGTFLLFSSGKVVIQGVKTEPDLLEFSLATDIFLTNSTLSHCSGCLKVGTLNLQDVSQRIGALYEPELHPGIIFHIDNVSIIVQHTGVIFFCGCRTVSQATEVKQEIIKLINTL